MIIRSSQMAHSHICHAWHRENLIYVKLDPLPGGTGHLMALLAFQSVLCDSDVKVLWSMIDMPSQSITVEQGRLYTELRTVSSLPHKDPCKAIRPFLRPCLFTNVVSLPVKLFKMNPLQWKLKAMADVRRKSSCVFRRSRFRQQQLD